MSNFKFEVSLPQEMEDIYGVNQTLNDEQKYFAIYATQLLANIFDNQEDNRSICVNKIG